VLFLYTFAKINTLNLLLMKKLKILLVVAFSITGCVITHAQIQNPTHVPKTVSLKKRVSNNRPKAPSSFSIECFYENGAMKLNLIGGLDNVYVQIIDCANHTLWDGYLSHAYNTVGIPELSGEYNIVCIDEYGNEFIGTLEFD